MPRKLDHWLLAYREYTAGTESPESFHLWAGLSLIAAAAQRKIKLKVGRLSFHSNLLAVLVGPAGGPRKTTALDMARSLIRDPEHIDLERYGVKLELGPEKASGAAVIKRMAAIPNKDHQSMTLILGELGTLLGERDSDMTDTITNFWDCRNYYDKDTVGRGNEAISAPWLNILAATTPIWLAENLSPTAVEGGLVSRGLFIYEADKIGRVAEPPEPPVELRHALVHDLAEIAQVVGLVTLDEEARSRYIDWYEHELDNEQVIDQRFITQRERKAANVLKVAMLLSIAQGDSLLVSQHDFDTALVLVSDLEGGMPLAFQGVGKNAYSLDYERIRQQIKKAGALSYAAIVRANIQSLTKVQIDEILSLLRQTGEVRIEGQTFKAA